MYKQGELGCYSEEGTLDVQESLSPQALFQWHIPGACQLRVSGACATCGPPGTHGRQCAQIDAT